MKKINLKAAAGEFEIISDNIHLFYNKKTGEFDYYTDFEENVVDIGNNKDYAEKFKNADWIACPDKWDINEYRIMENFAETLSNSSKIKSLCTALKGSGAFHRFKDKLNSLDLTDKWYEFKQKAFIEIVKEWCDKNRIKYDDEE